MRTTTTLLAALTFALAACGSASLVVGEATDSAKKSDEPKSEATATASATAEASATATAAPTASATAAPTATEKPAEKPAKPALTLPAAAKKDAKLEKEFGGLVTKQWEKDGTDDVIKVVLTEKDWTLVKNDITGKTVARVQHAAVVTKAKKDGKCRLFNVQFKQEGEKVFAKTFFDGSSLDGEIACDLAK